MSVWGSKKNGGILLLSEEITPKSIITWDGCSAWPMQRTFKQVVSIHWSLRRLWNWSTVKIFWRLSGDQGGSCSRSISTPRHWRKPPGSVQCRTSVWSPLWPPGLRRRQFRALRSVDALRWLGQPPSWSKNLTKESSSRFQHFKSLLLKLLMLSPMFLATQALHTMIRWMPTIFKISLRTIKKISPSMPFCLLWGHRASNWNSWL